MTDTTVRVRKEWLEDLLRLADRYDKSEGHQSFIDKAMLMGFIRSARYLLDREAGL